MCTRNEQKIKRTFVATAVSLIIWHFEFQILGHPAVLCAKLKKKIYKKHSSDIDGI